MKKESSLFWLLQDSMVWERTDSLRHCLGLLVLCLVFNVGGCSRSSSPPPLPAPEWQPSVPYPGPTAEEEDIQEVVFRDLIAQLKKEECIFLSVEKGPSGREFMKRFQGHKPSVKPSSECVTEWWDGKRMHYHVADRETGELGVLLFIETMKRVSEDLFRVEAGFYLEPMQASTYYFMVAKENGRWIVKNKSISKMT